MPIDPTVLAALAGAGGVITAKMLDVTLERFRLRHADHTDARAAMSTQSSQLFEQLGSQVKDLRTELREAEDRERQYREENAELKEQVTDLKADVRRLPRMERELRELRDLNTQQQRQIRELQSILRTYGYTGDIELLGSDEKGKP